MVSQTRFIRLPLTARKMDFPPATFFMTCSVGLSADAFVTCELLRMTLVPLSWNCIQ